MVFEKVAKSKKLRMSQTKFNTSKLKNLAGKTSMKYL